MQEEKRRAFAGFDLDRRTNTLSPLSPESLAAWLRGKGMTPLQQKLGALWKNWEAVMGPLAESARPMGHRDRILIVGGEDSCSMQELSFAVPEILERANGFLREDFFQKVELKLLAGLSSLLDVKVQPVPVMPVPPRPEHLGNLRFPENSPVASCYAAYLRCFDGENNAKTIS